MAGALDTIMRSVASGLIRTFGTAGTLIEYSGGSYDPETGISSSGAELKTVVKCSPPAEYANKDIDGTRILSGDCNTIIPYSEYEEKPVCGMIFEVAGKRFSVVGVEPYSSGNYEAAWNLQLRNIGPANEAQQYGGGLLDETMAGVARNLITTFGTTGYMVTASGSGYDPVTGTSTEAEPVETLVNCSPPAPYMDYEIDGTRIKDGDARIIIARKDYPSAPNVGDSFSVRGCLYGIVSVVEYRSGNQSAAWELQLRYQGRRQVCVYENVTVGGDPVTVGGYPVTVKVCA